MYETCRILHTGCVCSRVRTVECQVELEVREVFLNLQEVFQIEHLVQCTGTVEVVHRTVSDMQRLGQVHNLGTQRSHTCTTTDPHHFVLRIQNRVEVTVRSTHGHLVTWLQRKDVRRSDTRHHIHKARSLILRFERRSSDTYSQHDAVTLSRIVGHRISTDGRFVVAALQAEQTEFLPCRKIFVTDQALVDVLIIIHREGRNLDLGIRTRHKVHVFARRQSHDKLFDKRSHVLVRDHLALPLFHTQDRLVDLDRHILFHLHLASEAPVIGLFFTREETGFGRQNLATAFEHLATALSA